MTETAEGGGGLRARILREGARFGAAAAFLTRLPLPDTGWEEGRLRYALTWFPLVGLLVGLALGLALTLLAALLPGALAAGLTVAAGLWLTGALHEDGLADLADGIGGAGTSRERALEIMRDSRLGTYGAAALVVALGLRWSAYTALAVLEPEAVVAVMGAAGLLSRAAMLPLARLRAARAKGLGRRLVLPPGADPRGREALALTFAAILTLGLLLPFEAPANAVAAILGAVLATIVVARLALRRLGGVTGDVFGAAAVAAEIAVLVVLAGALQ
ncbi:MAG: adenosylcobinamide-GDP ribazoletransferase [Pseudomonadota bacterium]